MEESTAADSDVGVPRKREMLSVSPASVPTSSLVLSRTRRPGFWWVGFLTYSLVYRNVAGFWRRSNE